MVETDQNPFNVVLVESNEDIAKMMAFALETQFGVTVIEAQTSESALQFIKNVTDICLVIIGNPQNSKELIDAITQTADTKKIFGILCIDQRIKDPSALLSPNIIGLANRKQMIEDVTRLIREKFFDGEVVESTNRNEFCRIRAPLLVMASPLRGDVYISLSNQKYLKLFKKGDMFDSNDLEKYWLERHVSFFYIKRSEFADFLSKFNHEVEEMINAENIESAAIEAIAEDIHETVYGIINTLGVTEEVREMTKLNVKLVIKSVGNSPQLNDIFRRIHKEMRQYIVSHSLILAEITCMIASHVAWLSDLTFQKLILASLFHDISLKNHDLAKVRTIRETQINPDLLMMDSIDDFKSHPMKGAELVNLLHNAPPDADTVIRQHHERPDGSGFPQGLTCQYFSPLSCIFIIAHDYLDYALEQQETAHFGKFLMTHKGDYNGGYFKKIVKTLEDKLTAENQSKPS